MQQKVILFIIIRPSLTAFPFIYNVEKSNPNNEKSRRLERIKNSFLQGVRSVAFTEFFYICVFWIFVRLSTNSKRFSSQYSLKRLEWFLKLSQEQQVSTTELIVSLSFSLHQHWHLANSMLRVACTHQQKFSLSWTVNQVVSIFSSDSRRGALGEGRIIVLS